MSGRFIQFNGQSIDVDAQLFEISKADCEENLVDFIKQSWHTIEPGEPYVHGWHVDFVAAHLEAITDGVEISEGTPGRKSHYWCILL